MLLDMEKQSLMKREDYRGRNGEDLNENGIKQAENLAQKLSKVKFDIVISSPQNRAIQTAKIISLKNPLIDKRIDVYDLGEADRMKKDDVEMMGFIPNPEKYNGVENFEDFVDRIKDFLQSIKNIENINDLNILIVGHKCTVGAIDAYFNSFKEISNSMKNASKNGEYRVYNL